MRLHQLALTSNRFFLSFCIRHSHFLTSRQLLRQFCQFVLHCRQPLTLHNYMLVFTLSTLLRSLPNFLSTSFCTTARNSAHSQTYNNIPRNPYSRNCRFSPGLWILSLRFSRSDLKRLSEHIKTQHSGHLQGQGASASAIGQGSGLPWGISGILPSLICASISSHSSSVSCPLTKSLSMRSSSSFSMFSSVFNSFAIDRSPAFSAARAPARSRFTSVTPAVASSSAPYSSTKRDA